MEDGIFNGSRVLYSFNNQLYFNGNKETNNYELYSTDGSNNNFKLIKDIKIGSSGSYPHTFISTNSLMYFSASDNDHGRELWKTDGTEQGTSIVKDITSGSENTNIIQGVIFKNKLFFVVKNQNATTELYFSDGIDLGTNAFRPTNDTSIYAKDIQILCVTDSMLYFTANISKFGVGRELLKQVAQ
ncbi:MAG: hypothetical protein IPL95_03210 [Saprospiraceae bacterium]|nr:hypothetical protein [Saprospiraceae bacterium]